MEYNILRDWLSNHQFTWEKLGDILTYHHNAPILFSSGLFFVLFIGFLMIYMSLRKHTLARIIYVTLFSLYFYYKSSGLWFGLLVFTATSDFLIAQCISHTPRYAGVFQVFQFPRRTVYYGRRGRMA